ncbi:MAG: glycosyltransferase family 4 protein [Actinobacteria bacterium]|nr:glycosyltransferase family 4 protein [Actinomycetota bacterium]MBU1942088.1 glycosyltransferase family 4 protein [Actinomycetota bacterium]MBU2687349.1 glycosyltransferase family 4 protein [Actinomycetota bacterium]
MRIAMVSPYSWAHPGGVNNHVEGLVSGLLARGHEVMVMAPDAPRGAARPEGVLFADAGRSIPVRANGSVANLALIPGTGRRVREALAGFGPDVVHVHEPMVPLVSTSAASAGGARLVGTFHAAGEGSVLYALAGLTRKKLFLRLDRRIAVSGPARDLASRYFPGDYVIVPNGVDTARFKPGLPAPGGFPDGPTVLFVGRDEPRKGLGVLLEAFPAVREAVPGCRLVLAGSGIAPAKVARRLPAGLASEVAVVGFVPNEDLPAYYSAASVFCAPALGGESFGVVLIEAMASGTPVVASDIPGYASVVEQAGGGVLFPRDDSEGLAHEVADLLADEDRRRELSRRGIEGVKEFSWDRLAPRIEEIYRG